jgi:hypothetical protein
MPFYPLCPRNAGAERQFVFFRSPVESERHQFPKDKELNAGLR